MRESCDNSYKLQVLVILVLVPGLLMLLPPPATQYVVWHMIRDPLTRTWLKGKC